MSIRRDRNRRSGFFPTVTWFPPTANLFAYYHAQDCETSVDTPGAQSGFVPMLGDDSSNARTIMSSNNITCPIYDVAHLGGSLQFTTALASNLQVAAATAADWTFMHDGTGCTLVFTCRPTGTTAVEILADTTGTLSKQGYCAYYSGTNQAFGLKIRNDSGPILSIEGAVNSSLRDNDYTVAITFGLSSTPDAIIRVNGVQVASGNVSGTPSSTAPAFGGLCIGRLQAGNGDYYNGYWRNTTVYNTLCPLSTIQNLETNLLLAKTPRTLTRVWCVGDSITVDGHYEYQIWLRQIVNPRIRIDFLGTLLSADQVGFIDRQQNGYNSNTIAQIQVHIDGLDIGPHQPDQILLLAGTNNAGGNMAQAQADYNSLVTLLQAQHPTSLLRLGRPPRRIDSTVNHDWIEDFALFVQGYCTTNKLVYVPINEQTDAQVQPDGVHPTTLPPPSPTGYTVIGNLWSDSMGL